MAKKFNTVAEIRAYAEEKYSAFHSFINACGMSSVSSEGKAKMEVFSILIDACEFITEMDELLDAVFEQFFINTYSDDVQKLMRSWFHYNMQIDLAEDFFH